MNKYSWFMITSFYLILVSLIIISTADATEYSVGSAVPETLSTIGDSLTFGSAWAFIKLYFQILTFQITSFPPSLALLIFHPVALANGVLLLDIVKDIIPFT